MFEGKRVLVLGGTAFIGRAFCEAMLATTAAQLMLLNRGKTGTLLFPTVPRIQCDRNERDACQAAIRSTKIGVTTTKNNTRLTGKILNPLNGTIEGSTEAMPRPHWDAIVDFSAQNHTQIQNILQNCRCDHYTLVSSSAVDLSSPGDPYFEMAQNKLWCEHLIAKRVKNLLVIRPGFVVGPNDYTNRFERNEVTWCWKGTHNPVRPLIEVAFLVNTMVQLIHGGRTGIVRAGYSIPEM